MVVHIAEQLLFPMFISIVTLNAELSLRSILAFGGLIGLFLGPAGLHNLFLGLLIQTNNIYFHFSFHFSISALSCKFEFV